MSKKKDEKDEGEQAAIGAPAAPAAPAAAEARDARDNRDNRDRAVAEAPATTVAEAPATTVAEAQGKAEDLGRKPVSAADRATTDAIPEQFPSSGTIGGPTVVPVGTPNAQARPDLPRLGDGSARGETQPGIPPPGEQERALDPGFEERLAAQKKEGVASASVVNGLVTVRHRDGRALHVNLASVESVEDDGETVTVRTTAGKEYSFDGDDAGVVRPAFGPR